MYINKLHLRAFGKFAYKRMYLSNKFNIIYGENEAGKSTIHNFILALLYNFNEDEKGTDNYNKYKPWNNSLYKGSMGISNNAGEKYIVSKDFLLGTTQVFKKESSDRNEPEMIEEDIPCPGEYFFNINKLSFCNTVSVRQLGNKTEKELATELKSKIINLSKTRDESISMERILSHLNSIKEEAGSENNNKTLLGQYTLRLSELQNARENTLNASRQVMFLAMEKKKISSKIQELDMRIEELKKQLAEYELSIEKEKYLKAEPIKKELDEINEKLLSYKDEEMTKYSQDDYKEAMSLESILTSMKNQRNIIIQEKEKLETELEKLQADISNYIGEHFDINELKVDYSNNKKNDAIIKDMKSKILSGHESIKNIDIAEINKFIDDYNKVEEINRKIDVAKIFLDENNYDIMKNFGKSQSIKGFFTSLGGIVFVGAGAYSCYIGYTYNIIEYYYGAGALIPAIICFTSASRKKNKSKSAKCEIESMECGYADYTITLNQLESEKEEIVKQSGCENFDIMKEIFQKKNTEKNVVEEKLRLLKYDEDTLKEIEEANSELAKKLASILNILKLAEISDENIKSANDAYDRKDNVKDETSKLKNYLEQLKQGLSKSDKEISFEEKRLEMILDANDMDGLESFKKTASQYEEYEGLINRRDYCKNILNTILGNDDFNELKNKTKNAMFYETKELDEQKYQLNIFKMNDEKAKLVESVDNIYKEIGDIEKNSRSLAEVEEEIDFYEYKISTIKRKTKIAEIAAEKITKISESIKGDFMPLLKKSISDNFAYLTGGKYNEVVIDEDMNITVLSEDDKNRNIDLESLSGGTLDQLYLSLRIALSNILSGKQDIPLIFDDSFVQYDSKRLKKSIEMLASESERRQVILFTCQEREAEVAKQMNVKFNYIKL